MSEAPENRWPLATFTQRRYLEQLERVVGLSSQDVSWVESEIKEFRFYSHVARREIKTTKAISPDEKLTMRRKLQAQIYDLVVGTTAERYFREILAKGAKLSVND